MAERLSLRALLDVEARAYHQANTKEALRDRIEASQIAAAFKRQGVLTLDELMAYLSANDHVLRIRGMGFRKADFLCEALKRRGHYYTFDQIWDGTRSHSKRIRLIPL